MKPFDDLLLSQARLGIVSLLVSRGELPFSDLKALLGLTQGNLGAHLDKLEQAGYVHLRKEFVGKKPRTTASLTEAGRTAFLDHVERLREIAGEDGAGAP